MTKTAMRRELARLRRVARERHAEYADLCRRIERLDRDDPESRDAARVWSEQASHARYCAHEAERYADRLEGEIVDLEEAA